MATLAFSVEADYDKVIRLRDEIARLEAELSKVASNRTPEEIGRLESQLASCRDEMRGAVAVAAQLGMEIEQGLAQKAQEASQSIGALGGEARSALSGIGEMEFGTAQEKMDALSYAIYNNEVVLADSARQLRQWRDDARQAFEAGDTGTLETLTKNISDQANKMRDLSAQTEEYRAALQGMLEEAGAGAGGAAPVIRLFDSEEEIRHVEELEERITRLRSEIARVGASGGDTTALTQELTAASDELNDCRLRAAEAAQALGTDLGGRASEAQQRLYELNKAIGEQGDVIDTLQRKVDDARDAYETLSQAESASSDEVKRAAASYQALVASLSQAKENMAALQGQQADAQAQWNAVNKEVELHDSFIVKMCGGYENFNAAVSLLPAPLQKTVMGVMSLTKSAMGFIATPVGATIAAIALALQALYKWFNSSAEGQRAFAKVTGLVNGVLGQLNEILLRVGKYIYEAFSNPKKVVQDFGKLLESQVMNRVNAVGGMFTSLGKIMKSVFSGQWDEAKDTVSELGEQYMQAVTGVEDFAGKATKAVGKLTKAVKDTMDVEEAEYDLRRKRSEQEVRDSKYEQQIAELRNRSIRGTDEERMAATQEAMDLINKRYDEQVALAREEYELQKKRNNITTNSAEDLERQRHLEAQLYNVEAQRERARMRFLRQENALERRQSGGAGGGTDAGGGADERIKAEKQLSDRLLALEAENQQAEIELMEEGLEKRLAKIDYAYRQQVAKVEEAAREMAEANAKAGVADTDEGDLTAEQREQVDRRLSLLERSYNQERGEAEEAQAKAEERAWNEYLVKYGDYLERRRALVTKYETAVSDAETRGEAETLRREMEKALYDLDNEAARTTSLVARLFSDMSDKSIKELERLLDSAELVMQYLGAERDAEGNAVIGGRSVSERDVLDLGLTPETLARLKESPKDMESLRAAIANVRKELGSRSPVKQLGQDFKDAARKMREGDMEGGLQEMLKTLGDMLPVVRQLGDDLGAIFGDDRISEVAGGLTGAVEGLRGVGGGVLSAMSGDILGGMTGAVSGIAKMFSSLGGLFTSESDRHYERDMERLSATNEALTEAVNHLADVISSPTTSVLDRTEAYGKQIDNLNEQMANTQEQMLRSGSAYSNGFLGIGGSHSSNTKINDAMSREDWRKVSEAAGVSVRSAKDFWGLTSEQMYKVRTEASVTYAKIKDLADDGHKDAAQYMDEYTEYWKELEELTDAYNESIAQVSFDSLVDSFKSAVMDMEHTAADFANDFEELMKNAVVSAVVSDTYAPMLEDWYSEFVDAVQSGGNLDAKEQKALREEYMDIVERAQDEIRALYDTLGWDTASTAGQTASSGTFQTMSEDTGQELSGRFTAMYESMLRYEGEAQTQTAELSDLGDEMERALALAMELQDIAGETRSLLANSYLELQEIRDNTGTSAGCLRSIQRDMAEVRANTSRL